MNGFMFVYHVVKRLVQIVLDGVVVMLKINGRYIMKEFFENVVGDIPQCEQVQFDTEAQLTKLMVVGNRLGLYDAVDVLRKLQIEWGMKNNENV